MDVFSQYEENNSIITVLDAGNSLIYEGKMAVAFLINDGQIEECVLGEKGDHTFEILRKSDRSLVHNAFIETVNVKDVNLPFIIVENEGGFIPKYVEQIIESYEEKRLLSCYYIAGKLKIVECEIKGETTDRQRSYQIVADDNVCCSFECSINRIEISDDYMDDISAFVDENDVIRQEELQEINKESTGQESAENIELVYDTDILIIDDDSDEEESESNVVSVLSGIDYQPAKIGDIPGIEKADRVIGRDYTSGIEFEQEKNVLSGVVSELQKKIREIESKTTYTGKYAVVRGGDDGTESLQLRSRKDSSEKDREKVYELSECKASPYKYRVDIEENGNLKTYYFGPVAITDISGQKVYSFHGDFGRNLVNYNASNADINARLHLRRELTIKNSRLNKYRNISARTAENAKLFRDNLTDPFLIDILKMRRTDHGISDIIVTIQKNQNAIVDAKMKQDIIVQGCAGSGKTMVLMHRLSRLQNFVQAFNPRDVLLITPSDQYSLYMKAVTEGLAIQSIRQTTIENYYLRLLEAYSKDFKIKGQVISDFKSNSRLVQFVYSDGFVNEFNKQYELLIEERKSYFEVLSNLCADVGVVIRTRFPKMEKDIPLYYSKIDAEIQERIKTKQEKIKAKKQRLDALIERNSALNDKYIPEIQDKYSSKLKQSMMIAHELVAKCTDKEKREVMMNYFEKPYREMSHTEIMILLYKLQKYFSELDEYVDECEAREKQLVEYVNEKRDKDTLIKQAEEEYKLEQNSMLSSEVIQNAEMNTKKIRQMTHMGLFKRIYETALEAFLNAEQIKKDRGVHRYDLFARLLFCQRYFAENLGAHSFVCVDEGQDLAINEYKLLKELNDNPVFNIYGDVKQLIHSERGIDSWNKLASILPGYKKYELNENYRNTVEITSYCNDKFNLKTKKVGVNGAKVRKITNKEFLTELSKAKNISEERWAIIVPQGISKKELMDSISSSIVSQDMLGNGVISIMYVEEIKGFEFDRVYYFPDGMSENEQYIAATRALDNLVEVEMSKKTQKEDKSNNRKKVVFDLNDLKSYTLLSYEVLNKEHKKCDVCEITVKSGRGTKKIAVRINKDDYKAYIPDSMLRMYGAQVKAFFS